MTQPVCNAIKISKNVAPLGKMVLTTIVQANHNLQVYSITHETEIQHTIGYVRIKMQVNFQVDCRLLMLVMHIFILMMRLIASLTSIRQMGGSAGSLSNISRCISHYTIG